MKKGKLMGKVFGKAMVLVLIALVIGGLPAANNELAVSAAGSHLTYTVYATREGSVGGTTANGHVIVSHDHFVALPSTKVLCSNGGHEYEVKVTYNGKSVIAPVWDVGPWNTKDNYWDPPSQREMWQDLPQGKPEAQAAYQDGYNGGFDETNYLVKVSTGSDEFSVGDRVQPTVNGLKVRSTAGGAEIGSLLTSDKGTVIGGPQKAILNGLYYRWWNITWDKGLSGWSAQKRYVSNPAGIDLADGTFWDDLGMTDNDWVTVEFLWTTAEDTTPPAVDAFSVIPSSVTSGNAFTISYTVSDTGGSGLGWIQLWRKYETASWEQVGSTTLSGVGNGPHSGSFSDTPLTVGTYWYGIHVGDDAGNWVTETDSGFSPIEVEVIQANNPPQLSSGYVNPSSGTPSTNFYYYVTYFDPDGDSPSVRQVYIDGTAYAMSLYSGSASNGVYRYGPKNLSAGGTHYYFFYFEDGKGGWDRLPSGVDMYLGPTVTGPNNPPNTPSNPSPANHATGVSINSGLSWSGGDPNAGDTVTYDVYFGTSATPQLVSNDQSGNTYDPGTLSYNTKYYWKVAATDNHGASTTGLLWDFTTTPADQVVTFPDPNLEAAIREAIGKPTGDIYQSDLEMLTGLGAEGRSISNLTGLEYCVNLNNLGLYDNQIDDISPLSNLAKLERLSLGTNEIASIEAISGLTSLRDLELDTNQITDIQPLADVTGLVRLSLGYNQIADIQPISNLTNLQALNLISNQITSIESLASLTNLEELGLGFNQISNVQPVSNLINLRYLHLGPNQVQDIQPLANLTNLRDLSLGSNYITDIQPLADLINLEVLFLVNNQITDIQPLAGLTNLAELYVGFNQISDVSPLVANLGLSEGDTVNLQANPLSTDSLSIYIPQLEARGVTVYYDAPSTKTWYVDDDLADYPAADFTEIQDAVDAASPGDTIVVYPGTYTENVDVNKDHLTVRSEGGAEATIVQAANANDHVFEVTADYVNISGFTVKGGNFGIYLRFCLKNMLTDNNCLGNYFGITLYSASKNTLADNTCSDNYEAGIYLGSSSENTLENNTCSGHDKSGIILDFSSKNTLLNNTCSGHTYYGIYLYSSSENTLKNNTCFENYHVGIYLINSSNTNTIQNNTSTGNKWGIFFYLSSNNIIYLNNFIGNADNVYFGDSANTWNSPEEITHTYNGNTYTSYLGNYWSDYEDRYPGAGEIDSTGIWDTPYSIDSNADNYPLVEPFESYIGAPVADLEVYAYEDEFSRSWTRDSVTDLPICNSVIIYDISNEGSEVATNIQVSIEVDGNTFTQYTIPTLSEGATYIAGFTLSINYDSSRYVEITASTAGSFDTYGFLVDATLPRAAGYMTWQEEIGPLVKLFITPADSVIEDISSGFSDWKEIRNWLRNNYEYTKDSEAYGVQEYFQLPRETMEIGQGDCEDFAILMVSLLRAKGWNTDEAYVVAGYMPIWLGGYSHAWVLLKENSNWLSIDPRGTIVDDRLLASYNPVAAFNDNYFGRPIEVRSYSPIDIIVTDPDGLIASKQLNEIPSAWYSEIDLNEDGELVDKVVILDRKSGDYCITVIPEPGAAPGDTYTLEVSANGVAITLADDVQISDIPSEGYIVRSTETEIMQIIPAMIDFDPDTLNLESRGKFVTVYIELPPGYDVSQIDISSITLNGTVSALVKPTEIGDYDKDTVPDLMVKFDGAAVQDALTVGEEVEVTITGEVAGIGFEGSDIIRVINN